MKFTKIVTIAVAILMLLCALVSCTPNAETETESKRETATAAESHTESGTKAETLKETETEIAVTFDGSTYTSSEVDAIEQSGKVFTLKKAGIYRLSGTVTDGQIAVNVAKTEEVELKFDGLTVTNTTSAPIYIISADKVTVTLVADTVNTLTDSSSYVFEGTEDKPNACLYSSDDLTIKGKGTLVINAFYNNGIGTKNDLKIKGGTIIVKAPKNALKGNDSVTVEGGDITVTSCKRAMKSDSIEQGKGFVSVSGGKINVTADKNVIEASMSVTVSDCDIDYICGEEPILCDGAVSIAEGCMKTK